MLQDIQASNQVDLALVNGEAPVVIGFFGEFSAASRAARPAFEAFCRDNDDLPALLVDVGRVKDVHARFGVTSVPTAILVKDGAVLRKVIGPQDAAGYDRALVPHEHIARRSAEDGEKSHRVVVYVGAHCPWCTRVKAHLRQNRVRFQEVDVSADPSAARALQAKTGQTGVPQLDIDGHYIVGFDRARIDALLGLGGAEASL